MFNKIWRAITYIKNNGLNHLFYKIYKKAMYEYYKNKLVLSQEVPANKSQDNHLKNPKIVSYKKAEVPLVPDSKVSILLLFDGIKENLECCLESIIAKSTYHNYEVIIISFDELNIPIIGNKETSNKTRIVVYEKSHGLSSAVNNTVKMVEGDYIVLLSDNVKIVSPNWIEELLSCITYQGGGIAGPLLLSSDSTLRHEDIVPNVDANCVYEVPAVTRSCLMIDAKLYVECKGLNEYFIKSFADLDLCLRVREMGKTVQCTPKAIIQRISIDEEVYDIVDKALFNNCWAERLGNKPFLQNNLFLGV